jgi:hypothetical protein
MMRIRKNSRLEKRRKIWKFWESKELLWSKMKIERDWKIQGENNWMKRGAENQHG